MFSKLLILSTLAGSALAACPNACSGHGQCGEYDMCVCHTNWEGGDCNNRVCPYNHAWVTTSNGDLNFDGDRYDGTEYNPDYPVSQNDETAKLITQRAPGGSWEDWPYFGKGSEGHFYMECSNRGLCTRSTGECDCFEGYTGVACRRSVCPMDCSGHGTCETVAEYATLAGSSYQLWDRDMQRTCLCDPGYAGTACQERVCPYGDDPLTTGQYNEVQWVDFSATDTFAGNVAFSYTDYYGETWTTDYFALTPVIESGHDQQNADAEAVLESLPNDVLTDVTVTTEFCMSVIAGNFKTDAAGNFAAASNDATTFTLVADDVVYCPDAASGLMLMTGASAFTDLSGAAIGESAQDDITCFLVESAYCTRLKVEFKETPGNLADLSGVVDQMTVSGSTKAQVDNGQTSSTSSEVPVADAAAVVSQVLPSTVTHTCITADVSITNTYEINCANGDYTIFGTEELVTIECGSASTWKALGTYTVDDAATVTTGMLTLEEVPPTCSDGYRITLSSNFITVDADVTGMLGSGDRINVDGWATIEGTVTKVLFASPSSRVFLSEAHFATDGSSADADSDGSTELINIEGEGTTESSECSDRGLCNRETGICACFKGYTGDACGLQHVLSA